MINEKKHEFTYNFNLHFALSANPGAYALWHKEKTLFLEKQICILFFFLKGRVTAWQYVLENTVADICQFSCCQQ